MPDAIYNRKAVKARLKKTRPDPDGKEQGKQQSCKPGDTDCRQQQKPAKCAPGDKDCYEPSDKPGSQQNPSRPEQRAGSPENAPSEQDPAQAGDPAAQAAAEAAQRERMQRALERQEQTQPSTPPAQAAEARAETAGQRERRLANEAWLKRIPDDPGGLLRAKLRLEHERRQRDGGQ